MKTLNLVTGFWNIRKDRSEEKYLENFKNVLSLSHNLTIFIPKKYEDFVLSYRKEFLEKTDIIILELEDIKNNYFNDYWDLVQNIRTDEKWYNSQSWLKNNPQCFSEWYNPIVMSKVFLLHHAFKINKFNSDNYIWIDAGITQHISKDIVSNKNIDSLSNHINSVLFSSVDYIGTEVHGFDYNGYKKYTNIIPDWLCRATVFCCNKNYVEKFKQDYSYYLKDTLKEGYLGTEESIFSLLSCINSKIYKRYHTKNTNMPDLFLKELSKKDLIISAIANYNIDKIKTYVNSINKCGFDGDKVMITYNVPSDTIDYLKSNGWIVFGGQLIGHPHMKRLIDIYLALKELGSNYRYVITTDVRDVIFQTNPSEYLKLKLTKRILASSENVLYRNESWGTKNILEGYNEILLNRYKDEHSCNVGVLAGYYEDMMDLLLLNYLVSQAGDTQHFTDQSSFNFIIHNNLVKDKIQVEGIETNWALQIGTLDNPNLLGNPNFQIVDGIIFNNESPFVIVHQYDRNGEVLNQILHLYK
jgi:hypothetical protein